MSLLRTLRLYADRCPYCGRLMRLFTWQESPVPVPTLTHVRICPARHYMDAEHLSTRKVDRWEDSGRVPAILADLIDVPDPRSEPAPIHTNLNVPLRKPPAPPRPAAPAATPPAAAALAGTAQATPPAPTAPPVS